MLQTVRNYINSIPDEPFEKFYQRYVIESHNKILEARASRVEKQLTRIEDASIIIKGINELTEELKKL